MLSSMRSLSMRSCGMLRSSSLSLPCLSAPSLHQCLPSLGGSINSSNNSSSHLPSIQARFATKKAGGSVTNNSGSAGRRLGLKRSGGSQVQTGHILVRQRGTPTHPGRHVKKGKDDTLYALCPGTVHFTYIHRPFRASGKWRKFIHVLAEGETLESLKLENAQQQHAYNEELKRKQEGRPRMTPRRAYDIQCLKDRKLAQIQEYKAKLQSIKADGSSSADATQSTTATSESDSKTASV